MLEKDLEIKVRNWCKKNGWKRKKMSSPGVKGTLDDYFLKDGRHVWIELKVGNNTPTAHQWNEIEDLREHGGEAYWANSLEQVIFILEDHDIENKYKVLRGMLPPQEEYLL